MSVYVCPFCGNVNRCDLGDCKLCDLQNHCIKLIEVLQDEEVEICNECYKSRN